MDDDQVLSVGIDLGTSTTQLILSRLTVKNFASAFSVPRINISKKEVIFQSDIIFTPLKSSTQIDSQAIEQFVSEQYKKAQINKEDIQMGAVIITGETARKDNSSAVTTALSGYAGDFVVATAGPDLESIIAGKGAGTNIVSKKRRQNIVNIDIGGGTSNLGLFSSNDVLSTACFDVGGRLIKITPNKHKITYISPKIKELVDKLNIDIKEGAVTDEKQLAPIIECLTHILENSVGLGEPSPYLNLFVTNHPLNLDNRIDGVTFSGGVADCLEEQLPTDIFRYGDIGLLLGNSIRHSLIFQKMIVYPSVETIRATVVGAGSHTIDVTGSTIAYTEKVLPIRNLPILKIPKQYENLDSEKLSAEILEMLNWYKVQNELNNVALAFNGQKSPSFKCVQQYAQAIVKGTKVLVDQNYPLIVMVHEDMAKALGHSLFTLLPSHYPFVCIDSVKVENGDYIDIGEPIAGGEVLPVIVKTLVFG